MIRPVRILHIIDSLRLGGAERMLVELVRELHFSGEAVGVCVTRDGTELASLLPPEVPILVLNRSRKVEIQALRKFIHYCNLAGVSILHAHGRSTTRFCALAKSACRGLSLLFHDHDSNIALSNRMLFVMQHISRRLVDYYVGVSPELCQWARTILRVQSDHISQIGNAIDPTRFEVAAPLNDWPPVSPNQPLRAAIVANLTPPKDHLLLFRSIAQTRSVREKLHVYVVGRTPDKEYEAACKGAVDNLDLQDNVTFVGACQQVPRILKSVDFGLLSSNSESGPVVLLEYMASGLPFAATRTGQIASDVDSFGYGFFAPTGDAGRYSECLHTMIHMRPDERKHAAVTGQSLLRKSFSLKERIENLRQIYAAMEA